MHYITKHKLIIKIFSMIFIFIKIISRIHVFWTFTCAIICFFVCYQTKNSEKCVGKNMEKEIPTTFRSFFLLIFIIRRRRI